MGLEKGSSVEGMLGGEESSGGGRFLGAGGEREESGDVDVVDVDCLGAEVGLCALWRLVVGLAGEEVLLRDGGEWRFAGEPLPLVTRIVVRLSSLLPLRELG